MDQDADLTRLIAHDSTVAALDPRPLARMSALRQEGFALFSTESAFIREINGAPELIKGLQSGSGIVEGLSELSPIHMPDDTHSLGIHHRRVELVKEINNPPCFSSLIVRTYGFFEST